MYIIYIHMKIIDIHPNYLNDEIANKIVSNYELKKRYCRKYKDYFGGADADNQEQMRQELTEVRLPPGVEPQTFSDLIITEQTILQLFTLYRTVGESYPHYSAGLKSISAIKPLASYPPAGSSGHAYEQIVQLAKIFNINFQFTTPEYRKRYTEEARWKVTEKQYIENILLIIFKYNHPIIQPHLSLNNLIIRWNSYPVSPGGKYSCIFWLYNNKYITKLIETFNNYQGIDSEPLKDKEPLDQDTIFSSKLSEFKTVAELSPGDKLLMCLLFGNMFILNIDDTEAHINVVCSNKESIIHFYEEYFQNCEDAPVDVISGFLTAYSVEYKTETETEDPKYGDILNTMHLFDDMSPLRVHILLSYSQNRHFTLLIENYHVVADEILHIKTREYEVMYNDLIKMAVEMPLSLPPSSSPPLPPSSQLPPPLPR
jgi:hypothetical protein